MDALLLADRSAPGLSPLTGNGCLALLPVGARPLIDLAFDELADAGIRRCFLAVSAGSLDLRRHLEAGDRWGVSIEYVLTRGDEPLEFLLDRLDGRLADEVLVTEIDCVRDPLLSRFVELAATQRTSTHLECRANGRRSGLRLLRRSGNRRRLHLEDHPTKVDLAGVRAHHIRTVRGYYQLNVALAEGRLTAPHLHSEPMRPGVRLGPQSTLPASTAEPARVLTGARCDVHPEATLEGTVVLSDDVMVDRGSRLRDTVVLPGTYVPPSVEIDNAILDRSRIVQVDTGHCFELSATREACSSDHEPVVARLRTLANRLGGLILLLLSLPLWPIALLVGWSASGSRSPFERFRFQGCRTTLDANGQVQRPLVTGWRLRSRVPLLRGLPTLWSVVRGDLDLVGVRPQLQRLDRSRTDALELAAFDARPGLISPASVTVAANSCEMARQVSDALYALRSSAAATLGLLARAMLSLATPRAWRPHP